jgi:DNA replication protein DnaC
MVHLVGRRFAACWFDNYEIGDDENRDDREYALDTVKEFACSLKDNPRSGTNLILMGTCGTGKDHLAVSVIRAAVAFGLSTRYERGSVLCSICRKHNLEFSEEVPLQILNVDLLVVSDLEPNPNKASDFEERALTRLIDYRYSHMLPTVVTSNLPSRSAISKIIGERIADRLFHGSIDVPMIWPSYRKQK